MVTDAVKVLDDNPKAMMMMEDTQKLKPVLVRYRAAFSILLKVEYID